MTDSTASPSLGQTFTLARGDARVDVVSLGGHLRCYQVGERDVIRPFAAGEFPSSSAGAILAPWPNRLEDGRYTWRGDAHQVPINEVDRMTAIHGLTRWQLWQGVQIHDACVRMTTSLTPTPAYPFRLDFHVEYLLGAGGLEVTFTARNVGEEGAPYGVGFHPWLSPGPGGLDAATLSVDATTWYPTDERLLPIGIEPVPDRFEFLTARAVGDLAFDDAFGSPTFDARERSWVRLHGTDGATAAAWMTAPLAIWQLCSSAPADDGLRHGLAAEPMTCPANAFRSGDHLVTLAAKQSHEARWGLALLQD